jgi:hypothetical protein
MKWTPDHYDQFQGLDSKPKFQCHLPWSWADLSYELLFSLLVSTRTNFGWFVAICLEGQQQSALCSSSLQVSSIASPLLVIGLLSMHTQTRPYWQNDIVWFFFALINLAIVGESPMFWPLIWA